MNPKKVALLILDGWGLGKIPEADAIQKAETPYMDELRDNYPHSELVTFGELVGLPEGQMGNSEVGHLNIGAGRIVYQDLAKINKAVREKTLEQNAVLKDTIELARSGGKTIHLIGLLSDGGVHSHLDHLKALCTIFDRAGLEKVFIHAFMDGRDTDPKGGRKYLADLQNSLRDSNAKVASLIGRYYAMDRDKRWERIKLAYDLLVHGKGTATTNLVQALEQRYEAGETDEFIQPIVAANANGGPTATIRDGDILLCFNFRTDRPRQISSVLTQKDYPDHGMTKLDLHYVTMTRYDNTFENIHVLFEKSTLNNSLGEVLAGHNKTQVRIAETEKYPHVTYFFSGGIEKEFAGEKRILIPSPKVATYDLQPEMSAVEITDAIVAELEENEPDFICLNYANADMVGHTGVFAAAVKAVETVDRCLQTLIGKLLQHNYATIIIADHGNSDFMVNADNSPNTAHTKNLVPCIYVTKDDNAVGLADGKLADIAPTILELMGLPIPPEMDGNVLTS